MGRTSDCLLLSGMFALVSVAARAQPLPAPAQAIDPGLEVTRDGEALKNEPVLYVNKADCDNNASYEFTVTYTVAPRLVEAWVGVGSVDCAQEANRQRVSTTALTSTCKFVARSSELSLRSTLRVDAIDLFSSRRPSPDDPASESCDAVVNQIYTLFVLPLDQPTDVLSNSAYPPLRTETTRTRAARFTLFTVAPEAPRHLIPEDGSSEIGVRFDSIPGSVAGTRYHAYFDWGESDDAPCGSGALVAGADAPNLGHTIGVVSTHTDEATLSRLADKGVPEGKVAVAVTILDPAGNESALSAPVCAERLHDDTLIEPTKTSTKPKKSHSCSLIGAGHSPAHGVFSLGGSLALALTWLLRRRRAWARVSRGC